MSVDEATRSFMEKARAAGGKPRHLMTPAEAREAFKGMRQLISPGPDVQRVQDLSIPVKGAHLRARLLVPHGPVHALMVYFHGGGWVVGGIEEFDALCRELAVRSGVAVVLVEYRKAPEHEFPIPLQDAYQATSWVAQNQALLELPAPLPLWVGGDSAGANLAIGVTHLARQANGLVLAAQVLIYPVTDCRFDRPSYLDPDNQLLTTRDTMLRYWSLYAPNDEQRQSPLASPCRESNLSGLPPAIVLTAEHDVLRDEGQAYVAQLQAAGVPVLAETIAGQMHGFLMLIGILPGSEQGLQFLSRAMCRLTTKPLNGVAIGSEAP